MLLFPSPLFALQPVICIDPGHTSEVGSGTRGKRLTELRFAWDVAVDLRTRLQSRGIKVVMTKNRIDERVTNHRRSEIANASGAWLFVRLHCDAATNSGSTTYYPDRQGRAQGTVGPSREVLTATRRLAPIFHAAYAGTIRQGGLVDNGLKSDIYTAIGAKQGALTGSIFTKVPVVLVEMVVLTNPKDEAFALSKRGRETIVRGLESGTLAVIAATRR